MVLSKEQLIDASECGTKVTCVNCKNNIWHGDLEKCLMASSETALKLMKQNEQLNAENKRLIKDNDRLSGILSTIEDIYGSIEIEHALNVYNRANGGVNSGRGHYYKNNNQNF